MSRSLLRAFIVKTKQLLDTVRPYHALGAFLPPLAYARMLGGVLHPSARLEGRVRLYEPCWFQMNKGSFARNIETTGPWFCYLGEGAHVYDTVVEGHTLFLNDGPMVGASGDMSWTLGIDLEGSAAFCSPLSAQGQRITAEASHIAEQLADILCEFNIPTTWYVVGSMFTDPNMGRLCQRIIDNPLFSIGWHSSQHANFTVITREQAEADMEAARHIRNKFGVPLESMALPYNALGHVETLIDGGFSLLRCFVGQYYLPDTAVFDKLTVRCSSLFIGPTMVKEAMNRVQRAQGTLHAFLHPVDWIGHDIAALRSCLQFFLLSAQEKGIPLSI